MRRIFLTYFAIMVILTLGFFGVGALATAAEFRDPTQPPPKALLKIRQAKSADKPKQALPKVAKAVEQPLLLTSILFAPNRKIAIIDDQMLSVGDRIRGAKLIKITRTGARLLRKGKVIKLDLGTGINLIRKPSSEGER